MVFCIFKFLLCLYLIFFLATSSEKKTTSKYLIFGIVGNFYLRSPAYAVFQAVSNDVKKKN